MKLFFLKLRIRFKTIYKIVLKPKYFLLFLLVMLISLGLAVWALNYEVIGFILFQSPLSLTEKLRFLYDSYGVLLTNYSGFHATSTVVFSFLFGVNMAVFVYVLRRSTKPVRNKSGFASIVFAVVSGGCAACGTSLLAPLIASFGATGSVAFLKSAGSIMNMAGILLLLWSLRGLTTMASTLIAQHDS